MEIVFNGIIDVNHPFQMLSCITFGFCIFSTLVYFSNSFIQDSQTLFRNIGVRKIVYPKILTSKNKILRLKRENNEYGGVQSESLHITLDQWTIRTYFNRDLLVSPNYVSQWIYSDTKTKPSFDYHEQKLHECHPLRGSIREYDESSVLLTLCNNDIFGLINIKGKSFFLQPTDVDKRHILYETTIPYGLATIMKKYTPDLRNLTRNDDVYDPTENNNINNNEKDSNNDEGRCMALMIGHNGTRYIQVDSSLCVNMIHEDGDGDGIETVKDRKRLRRESEYSDYLYDYYEAESSYRKTLDCYEQQRNKRALSICDTAEYYNMSNDVASHDYIQFFNAQYDSNFGFKNDDEADVFNHVDEEQITYNPLRRLPAFRPPPRVIYRWVKIVIGIDYDVIRFHGQRTEHYVFTVFNIVSTLFKDISSTNVLRIVIMKMYFYQDREKSAIHGGDMKYPLYSVNKWNREVWQNTEEKYDMAVWYTHFKINEEESTSPGPYMCQWQWSCLLIEDVGWLSAIKIAHGIGHLIGLTHDGDLSADNNCALAALLETTIMAVVIPAVMPKPVWSSCSKSEYEFAVKKYPCLEKPPLSYEHTELFHGVFSLDEQCRIEFGDGWVFCSRVSVQDPCKELWCNKSIGKRRSCMTRQTRTLEGTLCSRGKRCINQTCEDATRPGYVQDIDSQRPQFPGDPEFTTPSYPTGQDDYEIPVPGYPQHTTYAPSRPGVPGSTYRPIVPGYPSSPPYGPERPPGYPGTTTYRPPGRPGYPDVTTYRPHSQPGFPGTTTYRPLGQLGYPETTNDSPGYQGGTTTYRPLGFPTFPNTTQHSSPSRPGYPESPPYGRPGSSYPENTTNSPLDQQNTTIPHYPSQVYSRRRSHTKFPRNQVVFL